MTFNNIKDVLYVVDITDPLTFLKIKLKAENISLIKTLQLTIFQNCVVRILSEVLGYHVNNYEYSLRVEDLDNNKLLYDAYKDIFECLIRILYFPFGMRLIYRVTYHVTTTVVNNKIYIVLSHRG